MFNFFCPHLYTNTTTDANGNSKAQTTTQEVNEETQAQSVAVDATVASTFSVSVPKTIQLDGAKKSASYKVTCSGDFPANKKVTVVPIPKPIKEPSGKPIPL